MAKARDQEAAVLRRLLAMPAESQAEVVDAVDRTGGGGMVNLVVGLRAMARLDLAARTRVIAYIRSRIGGAA